MPRHTPIALLLCFGAACSAPPATIVLEPASPTQVIPRVALEEDRCRILPTSRRGAVRAPYIDPTTGALRHIEAGSLAAIAILRHTNRRQKKPRATLAAILRHTRPTPAELGHLRNTALQSPDALPRDTASWTIVEHTVLTDDDVAATIFASNSCPSGTIRAALGETTGDHVKQSRPLTDIEALAAVKRVGRRQILGLLHLGSSGVCGEGCGPQICQVE